MPLLTTVAKPRRIVNHVIDHVSSLACPLLLGHWLVADDVPDCSSVIG
jgi:hypothetical protein